MSEPLYPRVHVQLMGEDGNAFGIIGRTRAALRRAEVPAARIDEFTLEASSGDYDHMLQTVMKWVDVS